MKYYCPFCLAEKDESDLSDRALNKQTYRLFNLPHSTLPVTNPTFYSRIFFANILICNKKPCLEIKAWAISTPLNFTIMASNVKGPPKWFGRWIYDEDNFHLLERLNSFILGSYLNHLSSQKIKKISEDQSENVTRIKLNNGRWKSNCKNCGKRYFHEYETQCYCSVKCKDKAAYLRAKGRQLLQNPLQRCL